MSTAQTLILGAIAGVTIFLGLPIGPRATAPAPAMRAGMTAFATGILIFLLWDVLGHGVEPVEAAVEGHHWGRFAGSRALLGGGLALGLMSLVYYDRWMTNKRATPLVGPGAAAVDEFEPRSWIESLTPGRRLALLIATGIGLHNFGEGLAIGQSAAADEVALALVLIIGFGAAQRDRGLRDRRADGRRGRAAELGLPRPDGPDRRRPDVPRHGDRPGLGERGARGRLLRRRGRLDPLRRDAAGRRVPAVRDADGRRLVDPRRARARLRARTSCSSPPGA